jgi:hypothetical protein
MMMEITDEQWAKLWERVDRESHDECWIWEGAISGVSVPQFYLHRPGQAGIAVTARRLIYEVTRGDELEDHEAVVTTCGTHLCVHPGHLVITTKAEIARRNAENSPLGKVRFPRKPPETCVNGHEFTRENTYFRKDGRGRQCKQCARDSVQKHRGRKARGQ